MLLQRHQQRTISSTMPRSRHADNGKEASPSSLVPPATWSIHDLQLLKEDAGQGGEEGLSQDEVGNGRGGKCGTTIARCIRCRFIIRAISSKHAADAAGGVRARVGGSGGRARPGKAAGGLGRHHSMHDAATGDELNPLERMIWACLI